MKNILGLIIFVLLFSNSYSQTSKCVVGDCENGFGVYFWASGDKYWGDWKGGNMEGYGTYNWAASGNKYSGEWKNNKLDGLGIATYPGGSTKSGLWSDGTLQSSNASTGCVSGDCENGYGTYVWAFDSQWAGDKYIGYWKGGLISGYGKYYWHTGDSYEGEWSNNKRNGKGIFYSSNGTKEEGIFVDNVFTGTSSNVTNNTTTNNTTGCIWGDCENGYGAYAWAEGDKYIGDWKGGNRTGKGVYIFGDGGKYVGSLSNSKRDGYGTYTFKNGDVFIGEWRQGNRHGQGVYTYADGTKKMGKWKNDVYDSNEMKRECISGNCENGYGSYIWDYNSEWKGDKYSGYWSNGYRNGQGTYYYGDGSTFEGTYILGKKNGIGTYTWADGSRYVGDWKDSKREGQGTYYKIDGTKQTGTWKNDELVNSNTSIEACLSGDCTNGYGVYVFKSGEKYEGNWKNDKRNGYGTNYFKNGHTYTGNWLDDLKHGTGTYTYTNGDKYTGEYKYDKKDGYGTYTFASGDKYVGNFKDGKYNGQGTMYYKNGTTKSGNWQDDTFVGENVVNYNTNSTGCVSGDCNNGYGVYAWDSGEKYEGYWQNGKRNGQGTNYFASKAKYVGTFKDDQKSGFGTYTYKPDYSYISYTGYFDNDKMNGQGTLIYRNGQKYIGSFKNDLYEGEGTLYLADGTVKSAGIWKNDLYVGNSGNGYGCTSGNCANGYGTYIYENGSKYVGEWKNNSYSQGTMYLSNGDKYIGDFRDNKRNGTGTYTFAIDNKKYVGEWVNDLYEGQGTMYYSDNTKKSGLWKAGEFIGENKVTNTKPYISWLSPEYFNTTSTTSSTQIKACIKSSSNIISYKVLVNNVEQYNNTRGYNVVVASDCDVTVDRSIDLVKGNNEIKIIAVNQTGSTTSEVRNIKWEVSTTVQQNKIALVIGNANYLSSPLRNPKNDAIAIAAELKKLGFEVTLLTDQSNAEMTKAVRAFGQKLAEKKGTGLFYFAGHGIQMDGENYLIPVDAKIEKEQDVEFEALRLNRVIGEMDFAQNDMNIVILDACRNNPFVRSFSRSAGGANNGLATTMAPKGTFIAYATAPGSVAADGSGNNGLYTQELLKAISIKDMKIEDVFKTVRYNVYEKSNKQQVTWENSSIFSDFYFAK